jgi:hypothetical protein
MADAEFEWQLRQVGRRRIQLADLRRVWLIAHPEQSQNVDRDSLLLAELNRMSLAGDQFKAEGGRAGQLDRDSVAASYGVLARAQTQRAGSGAATQRMDAAATRQFRGGAAT